MHTDIITAFRGSFYNYWFTTVPDELLDGVITEVIKDPRVMRVARNCQNQYNQLVVLKSVVFLCRFMGLGESVDITTGEGETSFNATLPSLGSTGAQSSVTQESFGASLSRSYSVPAIPEGVDPTQFPAGYLVDQIKSIEVSRKKSLWEMGGGSNNRKRGHNEQYKDRTPKC